MAVVVWGSARARVWVGTRWSLSVRGRPFFGVPHPTVPPNGLEGARGQTEHNRPERWLAVAEGASYRAGEGAVLLKAAVVRAEDRSRISLGREWPSDACEREGGIWSVGRARQVELWSRGTRLWSEPAACTAATARAPLRRSCCERRRRRRRSARPIPTAAVPVTLILDGPERRGAGPPHPPSRGRSGRHGGRRHAYGAPRPTFPPRRRAHAPAPWPI